MYLITNGDVVTEQEILAAHEVLIDGDRIAGIFPAGTINKNVVEQVIDAEGGLITPGFVDIHADFIETMASPRPTSIMDFNLSLRETEKVLASHGITTMFHSLSLYKHDEFGNKPIRKPDNVKQLIKLIHESHSCKHLIRHRFHARFEIDNFDQVESLRTFIKEDKVHLLSFMDHSPGQGQYRNLEVYRTTLKGYRAEISDDDIEQIIADNQVKEKMTLKMIKEIAALAMSKNIAIASHDDDSMDKIGLVKQFGATISEFPITMEVAREAKKQGLLTVAGAPNVLLGCSHSGNLSAAEAVLQNNVDVLCSDYYPPALLHAVFILAEKYDQDLAAMFRLVTVNPAKAVRMDQEIGSITEGKKADLLVVNKIEDNFPVITSVFVDGKLVTHTNYRV